MRIPILHDSQVLDYFMRGLKPSPFERIMQQTPKNFEEDAHLIEHTSLAQYIVQYQAHTYIGFIS